MVPVKAQCRKEEHCTYPSKSTEEKMGKLNVKLKDVKKHDSILFQSSGLSLKQGEEIVHSFKVKQIKCIEAQDMEALENKKSNYDSIFKDIVKQHINKRRRRKENRRKSNERKTKRT